MDATTIGVDLAKSVFEVAVADRHWRIVARHRFQSRTDATTAGVW